MCSSSSHNILLFSRLFLRQNILITIIFIVQIHIICPFRNCQFLSFLFQLTYLIFKCFLRNIISLGIIIAFHCFFHALIVKALTRKLCFNFFARVHLIAFFISIPIYFRINKAYFICTREKKLKQSFLWLLQQSMKKLYSKGNNVSKKTFKNQIRKLKKKGKKLTISEGANNMYLNNKDNCDKYILSKK